MVYKHHALKFAGNTKGYDICFNDKLKNKQIMARRHICSIRAPGPGGGLPYETDGDARRLA